jgi:hypothetical protein
VSLTERRWDMPLNVDAAILRSEPRAGLSVTRMASCSHVKPNSERFASSASDSAAKSKSSIRRSVEAQDLSRRQNGPRV